MRHHHQQQVHHGADASAQRHHSLDASSAQPAAVEVEQPVALALLPDATLEVMLRQSMVAPSDGAPLALVDAFIAQLKSVLTGSNYSNTLSSALAMVNNAYARSLG
jgi:hypothetical protein